MSQEKIDPYLVSLEKIRQHHTSLSTQEQKRLGRIHRDEKCEVSQRIHAREMLICSYFFRVLQISARHAETPAERQDLFQELSQKLIEKVDEYNPDRGCLSTAVDQRLRGHALDLKRAKYRKPVKISKEADFTDADNAMRFFRDLVDDQSTPEEAILLLREEFKELKKEDAEGAKIVVEYFGLDGEEPATFKQIGERDGRNYSKETARKKFKKALAMLATKMCVAVDEIPS